MNLLAPSPCGGPYTGTEKTESLLLCRSRHSVRETHDKQVPMDVPGTNKDHKRSKQKDPERAVVRKVPARGAMVPGLKLLGEGWDVTPDKEQGSEKCQRPEKTLCGRMARRDCAGQPGEAVPGRR